MDLAKALAANPGDRRQWVTAQLLDIDTVTNRAQVSIGGSLAVWLPFLPGVYTNITTVFVLRDVAGSGAGQLVLGPCYAEVEPPPPPPAPPPDVQDPDDPTLRTLTALVRPNFSGTYRVIRSAWDRWNVGRYGGSSTLYQGSAFGSGELVGLATYGTAVKNLGALKILSIRVSTPLATGGGNASLKGSAMGSEPAGAPTHAGDTFTGSSFVDLDAATCESFRTGAARGLATVGGSYRGTRGTSHPSGMALSVTYQRPR